MPLLYGYINPAPDVPCFIIPLFVEFFGSNRLLIQKISNDDLIESFFEMDLDRNCEIADRPLEAKLKQSAVWAFRLNKTKVIQGDARTVASELAPHLRKRAFSKHPLIQSQVARFCHDVERHRQGLALSFKMLASHSPTTAEIWRDAVIIAPVVRRELNNRMLGILTPQELDAIRVIGRKSQLEIELPRSTFDRTVGVSSSLKETIKIGRVFGFSDINFVLREGRDHVVLAHRRHDQFYGIVRSFSGTGFMIARSLNAVNDRGLIFPASVSRSEAKRIAADQPPRFEFTITNLSESNVHAALDFARDHNVDSIKVAVALQPLSFGSLRKTERVIPQLERLSQKFEYVFVIGNHILQRPYGDAPGLAATSKAIKYVRACINTFMEMARADDGPTSASRFRAMFPVGFCLVGRAYGTPRERSHSDLLQNAIGTTLNERLSLFTAKRIVIAGHPDIIRGRDVMSFVQDSVARTRDVVATLEHAESRPAITVLALGVKLRRTSAPDFREFCVGLLKLLGWKTLWEIEMIVIGQYGQSTPMPFGFLTRDDRAEDVLLDIQRRKATRGGVILTNFKPAQSLRDACSEMGIWIFHYSLLEEYTDFHREKKPGRLGLQ